MSIKVGDLIVVTPEYAILTDDATPDKVSTTTDFIRGYFTLDNRTGSFHYDWIMPAPLTLVLKRRLENEIV